MSCENSGVIPSTHRGPLWQRVLLAVTMALALVGMHHLTSQVCVEPGAHHGAIHSVTFADPLDPHPDSSDAGAFDELTPGLVCLALLVTVGVVVRAVSVVMARRRDLLAHRYASVLRTRHEDPPDLYILSISRT